ncbi:MAG: DUF4421 family protein [Bacteroidia bacterium]
MSNAKLQKMVKYFLFTALLFTGLLQSQSDTEATIIKNREYKNYDSTRYTKFERVLIVGIFQQYRTFETNISQKFDEVRDSLGLTSLNYIAESNFTGGVVLSYDKFQLAFGTRNKPQEDNEGRGYTKMFNIGLNVGDNRWISETYFRRFKGFYNDNRRVLDSTDQAKPNYFYLLPGLTSQLFSSRFMYFTNYPNFAYKAGFGCNFRQLKSSATWILGGSISHYSFYNDSSIVPLKSRPFYNDYANMRGFNSLNFAFNAGAAATLVLFKAWYASLYFTVGPEQQWRNYDFTTNHRKLSYISWSGTGRFSMGLNMKRFYMYYCFTNDYNLYDSGTPKNKTVEFRVNSITNNFTLGWRFNVKTPKFYEKFMETKLYSKL